MHYVWDTMHYAWDTIGWDTMHGTLLGGTLCSMGATLCSMGETLPGGTLCGMVAGHYSAILCMVTLMTLMVLWVPFCISVLVKFPIDL